MTSQRHTYLCRSITMQNTVRNYTALRKWQQVLLQGPLSLKAQCLARFTVPAMNSFQVTPTRQLLFSPEINVPLWHHWGQLPGPVIVTSRFYISFGLLIAFLSQQLAQHLQIWRANSHKGGFLVSFRWISPSRMCEVCDVLTNRVLSSSYGKQPRASVTVYNVLEVSQTANNMKRGFLCLPLGFLSDILRHFGGTLSYHVT